jgi:hypothetical protein
VGRSLLGAIYYNRMLISTREHPDRRRRASTGGAEGFVAQDQGCHLLLAAAMTRGKVVVTILLDCSNLHRAPDLGCACKFHHRRFERHSRLSLLEGELVVYMARTWPCIAPKTMDT